MIFAFPTYDTVGNLSTSDYVSWASASTSASPKSNYSSSVIVFWQVVEWYHMALRHYRFAFLSVCLGFRNESLEPCGPFVLAVTKAQKVQVVIFVLLFIQTY